MIGKKNIEDFINNQNFDLRISHNARWIDQKCTPDVLWSISDFVINYVDNISTEFTPKNIWQSEYAKKTIADTYSKPGTDNSTASSEYDKVFSQPLSMLNYAGVIEDVGNGKRHLYRVKNRDVLEYISRNDLNALYFIQIYSEKVLADSGLMSVFSDYFKYQDSFHFTQMKNAVINFYHEYTPVKKDYEPKRIFTKILNPLAYKYGKRGTESGQMSQSIIVRSDLMYNRDNFRDIYSDKPKGVSREEWRAAHPEFKIREGYFDQQMSAAKRILREYIAEYRDNLSELTMFNILQKDRMPATQIHHIFPIKDYPSIRHYLENLIALTPNQHYGYAHPRNNTQEIDPIAQKELLIAKTYSIKTNLESPIEEKIFDFTRFKEVLRTGWKNEEVMDIKSGDYIGIIHSINVYYSDYLH